MYVACPDVRTAAQRGCDTLKAMDAESTMDAKHARFMRLAIAEARAAEAAGEVPVGAIVVSAIGEVVGSGNNAVLRDSDPTAHAEVVAMRAAGRKLGNYRLLGCTLYCTLEPCAMCAGAMLHARLAALVYAAHDPKAGACGSALQVMNHPALNHRMQVSSGICGAECGTMLSQFFQVRRARIGSPPAPDDASESAVGRSRHDNEED